MRKIVAVLLSAMLLMAFGSTAYAADQVSEPTEAPLSGTAESYVTDPEVLAQIAEEQGLAVPEGRRLVAVRMTEVILPSSDGLLKAAASTAASTYTITNVVTLGYRYYSNDYDSYWYSGPYTLSATFSQTRSAGYSCTVSVGSSLVSAAVGFSVTSSYTKSGSHSATVPSGQTLQVRVHMNYKVKTFDVYSNGVKVGSGSAWQPYSLLFFDYFYA